MTQAASTRRMILCAGLQSGGTTLISWCILQRRDTNGVLDMSHDVIQTSFDKVDAPIVWVKMTVASFRWLDVCGVYCDLGWDPVPILIVRDTRTAYSSLIGKGYGFNGTTAEEPPLRTRFRRFLQDWELFRANGWTIVKYEDFIQDERRTLLRICQAADLAWDDAMLSWPKKASEIAYMSEANDTFAASMGKGWLAAAKLPGKAEVRIDHLPITELEWLERMFSSYNDCHGYPTKVQPAATGAVPISMAPPSSAESPVRQWYRREAERLWDENAQLWRENERLRIENERLRGPHERRTQPR